MALPSCPSVASPAVVVSALVHAPPHLEISSGCSQPYQLRSTQAWPCYQPTQSRGGKAGRSTHPSSHEKLASELSGGVVEGELLTA